MPALLEARDVRKQYGGVAALAGVSLDVAEGEILGVLGPNGSGKTTLFNVISGVTSPTSGSITFRGHPIGGKKPRAIVRYGLSRSFQEAMSFKSFTVRESLALVPRIRRPTGSGRRVDSDPAAVVPSDGCASARDRKSQDFAECSCASPSELADEPDDALWQEQRDADEQSAECVEPHFRQGRGEISLGVVDQHRAERRTVQRAASANGNPHHHFN